MGAVDLLKKVNKDCESVEKLEFFKNRGKLVQNHGETNKSSWTRKVHYASLL